MIEGYTLRSVLGQGSAGTVHRAESVTHPGRIVAVKRVPHARGAEEVRREAEALARLAHPSIVRLLDVVDDGEGVALVTPYLPGGSLADRIASGPRPALEVADLAARVGDALAAAHDAGVAHRDVKPANVLYDAEEQPLLADFGAARLLGDPDGEVVGSASYLDPALLDGTVSPGPASDQYGLAATLYEALAGVPAYAAPTSEATLRAAGRGVHAPLAGLAPQAPPELVELIERGLSRDPAARFTTVKELAARAAELTTRMLVDDADRSAPTWRAPSHRPSGRRATPPASPLGRGPHPAHGEVAGGGPPPPPPSGRRGVDPAAAGAGTAAAADAGTASAADADPREGAAPDRRRPGAAAAPAATTRFGPAPPRPQQPSEPSVARLRRPAWLAAALAVLLVPVAIVVALVAGGDDPASTVTAEDAGPAPSPDRGELPVCDDAPDAPDAPEVVPADLHGEGCTVPLGWDPDELVLTVPSVDGPQRYRLGEPDDRLLVGDWTCDGADLPALYRPDTGQVFTFSGFAGDGELESEPAEETGEVGGDPVVVRDDDGCDQVEVR